MQTIATNKSAIRPTMMIGYEEYVMLIVFCGVWYRFVAEVSGVPSVMESFTISE